MRAVYGKASLPRPKLKTNPYFLLPKSHEMNALNATSITISNAISGTLKNLVLVAVR